MKEEHGTAQHDTLSGEHKKYLDELVEELIGDEEWELPKKQRGILKKDLAWALTSL
ncbi:MAG: hypothetical protein NC131_16460 [Roseburia sp.]|nr:hypothetical protein [Roseburia sp.]